MLTNYENYTYYQELVKTGHQIVHSSEITASNWRQHELGILNIMKDGIETTQVQHSYVTIIFDHDNGYDVDLYIPDYFMNIIMWSVIICSNQAIKARHIYFNDAITADTIAEYMNNFLIEPKRRILPTKYINNIIDDCMYEWFNINDFSLYLCNTINLEDMMKLMIKNPRFNQLVHTNSSNIPLDNLKDTLNSNLNEMIDIIEKDEDNCYSVYFKSHECINPKQFKEVFCNIGTKPNGQGGIYPVTIPNNYVTGGVNTPGSFYIDASTGRIAQIIVKSNTGDSGAFARILGLNNTDTFLNQDPNYACSTKNFEIVEIKNKKILKCLYGKYARLNPNGVEFIIDRCKENMLLGKTIYLRSPMTCASASAGNGICYRCYGDLAYTNSDINIGKIASELLSSRLTQKMLSAKHLLESAIRALRWVQGFDKYLNINYNVIQLRDDIAEIKGSLIIDPYNIELENELEIMSDYNEYITSFEISTAEGTSTISTLDEDKLYITFELNEIIREKSKNKNGKFEISLDELKDIPLFLVEIHNNELSATLDKIINIINKESITSTFDRNSILQTLLETTLEGGININIVHLETILMNQIRNVDDILDKPEWQYENEPYRLCTLNTALTDNPSLTISLEYQKVGRCLSNPLSERKTKPSFMDIFFCEKPQEYLSNKEYISNSNRFKTDELLDPFIFITENEDYTIGNTYDE